METTDKNIRILVVDDEETLCEVLRYNLEEAGFAVDVALSAEEAMTLNLNDYSLILLDIMMGDISGIQLASIIRKNKATADIPIIFCTAKDSEEDMIGGLDLGADDYITKPYSIRNVIARVKAVLRRSGHGKNQPEQDTVSMEGLQLSLSRKICYIDGQEVKMPRKEFEILSLLKEIWPDEVVVLDRVVDVNITRLRAKLGRYGKHIVTRPGYGYGFMD